MNLGELRILIADALGVQQAYPGNALAGIPERETLKFDRYINSAQKRVWAEYCMRATKRRVTSEDIITWPAGQRLLKFDPKRAIYSISFNPSLPGFFRDGDYHPDGYIWYDVNAIRTESDTGPAQDTKVTVLYHRNVPDLVNADDEPSWLPEHVQDVLFWEALQLAATFTGASLTSEQMLAARTAREQFHLWAMQQD